MISISSSLANAATARSRAPICKVVAREGSITEPTVLTSDGSLPYRLARFQAGSGFYIITATSSSTIYYKRTTGVDSASDWTSGYSSLATATNANAAQHHDMIIVADRVMVAYEKSAGIIYMRESTDGGQNWDAEYELIDLSSAESNVLDLSIADIYTIFVRTNYSYTTGDDGMYKISRSTPGSTSWYQDSRWDCGWHYAKSFLNWIYQNHSIQARQLSTAHYRIIGSWVKGSYDFFSWPHVIDCSYGGWSTLDPLFGGYLSADDYAWFITGLSRDFNGYYFGSIYERYIASADSVDNEIQYEHFLCRTEDLKTFSLVPFGRRSLANTENTWWAICGIALTENSDYVCIPMTQNGTSASNGVVYLAEPSAWFGTTGTDEDITGRVVEDISISRAANKAASFNLSLSCREDNFENSAVGSPGAEIDVYAGYTTGAGDELQKRFSGAITSRGRTVGGDGVLRANVLDKLAVATSRKQRLPAVLRGQNVFVADFTSPTDIDLFMQQEGVFNIDSNALTASVDGRHITLAGYDPGDAHTVITKFKITGSEVTPSVSDVGIVFHGKTYWDDITHYKSIVWQSWSEKFYYQEFWVYPDGNIDGKLHVQGSVTMSVSLNTWYWIMVRLKHGQVDAWYSTDGITWTSCLSGIDVMAYDYPFGSTYLDPDGYVGLIGTLTQYLGSGNAQIRFDGLSVCSMYRPQSGSDVMKYLAAISNMAVDEKMEIEDTFPGTSFADDWDTPGVDGTWSCNSGSAEGYKTTDAALLRCSTNAVNVIVRASVNYDQATGIFGRGNSALSQCYALLLDGSYVYLKKKDTSWTTLMQVAWNPPTVGGPGPIQAADLILNCYGPWITGFVNGALAVYTYDTDFTSGYCGMVGEGTAVSPSVIYDFEIDGFYSAVDVGVVRPGDTAASIMTQIANMYDGGAFFCDPDGQLKWGTFTGVTADLDVRQTTIAMTVDEQIDRLLSYLRLVGENSYGEVKDRDWGRALAGYEYDAIEDKSVRSRQACNELAQAILDESQRIASNTASIIGHPGLEIGDIIDIAEEPGGTPDPRRVWAYTEVIGSIYQINMTDLRTQTEETP